MRSRFSPWASVAAFLLLLAISSSAQRAGHALPVLDHDRAVQLIRQAMDALGGEDKLREVRALEINGVGVTNELEQSERPEGPWLPNFFENTEVRDFRQLRMRTVTQTRTLNASGWDNASWSNPGIGVTSGGSTARVVQGKFVSNPVSWASDDEETVALDPLHVFTVALEARDLRTAPDMQLHGYAQHATELFVEGGAGSCLFEQLFAHADLY